MTQTLIRNVERFLYLSVKKNNTRIVSSYTKPLWQIIVAAFFYTMAAICLLLFLFILFSHDANKREYLGFIKGLIGCVELMGMFIACALPFSLTQSILFDFDDCSYTKIYELGLIKYCKKYPLPGIEYVSLFSQILKNGNYSFEVNLWYDRNKHFTIYESDDFEEVYDMGLMLRNY